MHGPLLALMTFLFACRVLGQALVAFVGVSWLPAMKQWFSGVIPYSSLLIIQLLMLMLMVKITGEVWRGTGTFAVVRPHWAEFLMKFAGAYAGLHDPALCSDHDSPSRDALVRRRHSNYFSLRLGRVHIRSRPLSPGDDRLMKIFA